MNDPESGGDECSPYRSKPRDLDSRTTSRNASISAYIRKNRINGLDPSSFGSIYKLIPGEETFPSLPGPGCPQVGCIVLESNCQRGHPLRRRSNFIRFYNTQGTFNNWHDIDRIIQSRFSQDLGDPFINLLYLLSRFAFWQAGSS